MTLKDVNSLVSFILKDTKPDLILTKSLFERILHSGQTKQFMELLPAFETNRIISVELSHLKVVMGDDKPELTINSHGKATLPTDYYYASTVRFKNIKGSEATYYDVPILTDKEFDDRVASSLFAPSFNYPICNQQAGYMRFAPKNLKKAYFVYLAKPTYPVYATTTTRGFQEWDEANSTVWGWNDISTISIIQKLLQELTIELSVEQINNYQKQEKQ